MRSSWTQTPSLSGLAFDRGLREAHRRPALEARTAGRGVEPSARMLTPWRPSGVRRSMPAMPRSTLQRSISKSGELAVHNRRLEEDRAEAVRLLRRLAAGPARAKDSSFAGSRLRGIRARCSVFRRRSTRVCSTSTVCSRRATRSRPRHGPTRSIRFFSPMPARRRLRPVRPSPRLRGAPGGAAPASRGFIASSQREGLSLPEGSPADPPGIGHDCRPLGTQGRGGAPAARARGSGRFRSGALLISRLHGCSGSGGRSSRQACTPER